MRCPCEFPMSTFRVISSKPKGIQIFAKIHCSRDSMRELEKIFLVWE